MLLGARFVCPRCRLRGPLRACPGCGRARLDLADDASRTQLHAAWRLYEAWQRGLSVLSPRAIRMHQQLIALSKALGVTAGVAAPVGVALNDAHRPLLGAALFVGVVMAPVVAAFFAVFFFYYAQLLRLLALVADALLGLLPLGHRRLRLVHAIFRWISQGLVPLVEPDPEPVAFERTATLASALAVRRVSDGLAWVQCADAWMDAFEVELAGQRVRVEPAHGSVRFAMSYYRDLAAARGHGPADKPRAPYRERASIDGERAAVPGWLASPGRAQPVRITEVAAGRPVRLAGGAWVNGAVAGTPDAPLAIEIG